MSTAAGTIALKELWGHVLAQLPMCPATTERQWIMINMDYFKAPETETSHTTRGKEEKQSRDAQGSTTNILPGKQNL